ncbi:MAG: hypothetical protein LUQ16_05825 [Methanomassiliicoccales archaeon]|nr:hypothetical protein [Methanomassiliicoccales archaeon]MDD1755351.1 hypothetical protein [Methanomassiliicoccales archaeon]
MAVEQSLEKNKLAQSSTTEVSLATVNSERARLERSEDLIQLTLAAVVPGIIAMMLYSYFLIPDLLPFLFVLAVAVSAFMLVPANSMMRLHYRTWSVDSLMPKLMTSLVGMIYILVVAVFAISMMSLFEGLNPERPTTFATIGGLLLSLIVVMGYSSQTKDKYLTREKRFFPHPVEAIEERIAMRLERQGHRHKRNQGSAGTEFEIEGTDLRVHVRRLRKTHSEVLVCNINDSNREHLERIKTCIEGA